MTAEGTATEAVRTAARAARATVTGLASAPDSAIDAALAAMAEALETAAPAVLLANEQDMRAAAGHGLPDGVRDRLRLDSKRLAAMAAQLEILAGVPAEPASRWVRDLPGGLVLTAERRRGRRVAADQVAQRGRAAHRQRRARLGDRSRGRGDRASARQGGP
jgi:glutamate-5-semialdehyde dehydrogenase